MSAIRYGFALLFYLFCCSILINFDDGEGIDLFYLCKILVGLMKSDKILSEL